MLKRENYPNAYKEVYVILNNMNKEDVKLIPTEFMNMIKKNMNDEYEFKLEGEDFEGQNLLRETRAILAYIFMHYWATEEQRERINKKFKQDIINEEIAKGKYDRDEMFKNRKEYIQSEQIQENASEKIDSEALQKELEMIEKKQENIFKRIIKKIKDMFFKK